MKLTKDLLLLLCIIFCSDIGMARTAAAHSLKGAVITPDGTVVPEFTVVVKPVTNKPELIQRKRFKNGEFAFHGLSREKYEIEIISPLYVTARIDVNFTDQGRLNDFCIVILHTYRDAPQLIPPPQRVPDIARAAYMKGVELHRNGHLGEALMAYGEAIRAFPQYVPALSDIGTIYTLFDRPETALTFLRRAQQVDSGNVVVRLNIAQALIARRQYDDAVRILQPMLSVEPQKNLILYNIARAQYAERKYDLAEKTIREAIDEDPQFLDAWLLFVNVAMERKDNITAREGLVHLRKAMNNGGFSKFVDEQIAMLGND